MSSSPPLIFCSSFSFLVVGSSVFPSKVSKFQPQSNCLLSHACVLQTSCRCEETQQEHQGSSGGTGQGHLQPHRKGKCTEWENIQTCFLLSLWRVLWPVVVFVIHRVPLEICRSSLNKWWVTKQVLGFISKSVWRQSSHLFTPGSVR